MEQEHEENSTKQELYIVQITKIIFFSNSLIINQGNIN